MHQAGLASRNAGRKLLFGVSGHEQGEEGEDYYGKDHCLVLSPLGQSGLGRSCSAGLSITPQGGEKLQGTVRLLAARSAPPRACGNRRS